MRMIPIDQVTSAEQAHDLAIDWQLEFDNQSRSWMYIHRIQSYFTKLVDKFPELREEFEENGII